MAILYNQIRHAKHFGRADVILRLFLFSAVLLGVTGGHAVAGSAELAAWPASGEIRYDVMKGKNGFKLGEGRHRWQHDAKQYLMETELQTTGVAGALFDFSYTQQSRGLINESGLQPERFGVEQSGKKDQFAVFDWNKKQVTVTRHSKTRTADLQPGDQDVLSIWHYFSTRAPFDGQHELNLVTQRRVNPSVVTVVGEERINLPMGKGLQTLHVSLMAKSGKMHIDLWLSKQQHLLPLRILIVDDKGDVYDQQATALQLNKAVTIQPID